MKKIIILLMMACMLALAPASSFATVQSFTNFTLDVPDGWTATENGSVLALIAPGNVASMSIVLDDSQGMDIASLANVFVSQMHGENLQATDDGGYEFSFKNPAGIDSHSILYLEDGKYLLMTVTGEHPDMGRILDSLQEN